MTGKFGTSQGKGCHANRVEAGGGGEGGRRGGGNVYAKRVKHAGLHTGLQLLSHALQLEHAAFVGKVTSGQQCEVVVDM